MTVSILKIDTFGMYHIKDIEIFKSIEKYFKNDK